MQCTKVDFRILGRLSRGHFVHTIGQSLTECASDWSTVCVRVSVISRILLSMTTASTNGRPKPKLLLVLRYTNPSQHWPKPGSWTLVYTHRSSNDHRSHVKTQSHLGSKARWTLYVHTQETVDHTLLSVAACSKTVVSVYQCACETALQGPLDATTPKMKQ